MANDSEEPWTPLKVPTATQGLSSIMQLVTRNRLWPLLSIIAIIVVAMSSSCVLSCELSAARDTHSHSSHSHESGHESQSPAHESSGTGHHCLPHATAFQERHVPCSCDCAPEMLLTRPAARSEAARAGAAPDETVAPPSGSYSVAAPVIIRGRCVPFGTGPPSHFSTPYPPSRAPPVFI